MKFFESLYGHTEAAVDVTVRHGGTTLATGALIARGATPGTNNGMGIVPAASLADCIGLLLEEFLSTATDSNIDATTDTKRRVLRAPGCIYLAQYSQAAADDLAVTSSSGTTFTVTDLEDDIDGGWILTVNNTTTTGNNRQLRVLTASAAGSATLKSAFSADLTSADNFVKVLPRMHQLLVIITNATLLVTTAAVGTARATVVENYVEDTGIPFKPLDPVGDSPRLLTASARIYSAIAINNSVYTPFD